MKHLHTAFFSIFIGILVINQILIGSVSEEFGMSMKWHAWKNGFGANTAHAMSIMMPVLDEGGSTTSLKRMPTITPLPEEPNSDDVVADAMTVMMATGKPFYAPDTISFDDPVGALDGWRRYERIQLPPEQQNRYKFLIGVFTCNFCCGSATNVTVNGRCGCAHSAAARGFFKYMLEVYGDTYSDDELVGEAYRWQAIWYPSGAVEDYLLATGRGDVLGHGTHGGAGTGGMHGIR